MSLESKKMDFFKWIFFGLLCSSFVLEIGEVRPRRTRLTERISGAIWVCFTFNFFLSWFSWFASFLGLSIFSFQLSFFLAFSLSLSLSLSQCFWFIMLKCMASFIWICSFQDRNLNLYGLLKTIDENVVLILKPSERDTEVILVHELFLNVLAYCIQHLKEFYLSLLLFRHVIKQVYFIQYSWCKPYKGLVQN